MSLWKSNLINVLRYTINQAFLFMFKEYTNCAIKEHKLCEGNELMKNILAGGIAGMLSALIVYPLDYARTRMAVDLGKNIKDRQFKGLIDCMRKTF
jgi:solute carrier family 25 (adenine nucleotide translocator) protein 4/5/6/31